MEASSLLARRDRALPDALRKQLERHVERAPDGGIEATLDGVRARKFANRWRVCFGSRWTEEVLVGSPSQAGGRSGRGDPRL